HDLQLAAAHQPAQLLLVELLHACALDVLHETEVLRGHPCRNLRQQGVADIRRGRLRRLVARGQDDDGQGTLTPLIVDRKSTRLNSSHVSNSYAVFCLKKKKNKRTVLIHNSKMRGDRRQITRK